MTLVAERPTFIASPVAFGVPIDVTTIDLARYKEFAGRMRFTREICDSLESIGFLTERFELLDGEIIVKLSHNRPHTMTLSRLVGWLISVYGSTQVQNQSDVEVSGSDTPSNRPQPDVAVLTHPDYEVANTPTAADICLLIEVSDTTLRDDLLIKTALYARAEFPEYWVIDINGRKLYVHRAPVTGAYTEVSVLDEGETISPLSAPAHTVRISDLLPPVTDAE